MIGNEEVWVDRWSGRVCMSISAKGMAITGIDDRRYWNRILTDESSIHWKRARSKGRRRGDKESRRATMAILVGFEPALLGIDWITRRRRYVVSSASTDDDKVEFFMMMKGCMTAVGWWWLTWTCCR